MAAITKNRIDQYIERKTFRLERAINQEDPDKPRTKKEATTSNRINTQSNQKGVHYVKQ